MCHLGVEAWTGTFLGWVHSRRGDVTTGSPLCPASLGMWAVLKIWQTATKAPAVSSAQSQMQRPRNGFLLHESRFKKAETFLEPSQPPAGRLSLCLMGQNLGTFLGPLQCGQSHHDPLGCATHCLGWGRLGLSCAYVHPPGFCEEGAGQQEEWPPITVSSQQVCLCFHQRLKGCLKYISSRSLLSARYFNTDRAP